jgi:glycosyltransferase involved in cell wall biosynthesis
VPAFSVVIPTYGRPAFLTEAITSVLAQNFGDFECIVVDDASPEPATLPPDTRLRLIRREDNGGPPAARNTGIEAAGGDFVAFLDDDDVWLPSRLERAIETHQRAPIAVCWQSTLGASQEPSGRVLEGDVSDELLDSLIPHLGATSVARDQVPQFDERYEASDDVEWWLRMMRAGMSVATAPSVGLLYRQHAAYRPRTGAEKRLANGYMLLDEHADWFACHARAKAFRLKRMGFYASQLGRRREAMSLLASSLRNDPKLKTAGHLAYAAVARADTTSAG